MEKTAENYLKGFEHALKLCLKFKTGSEKFIIELLTSLSFGLGEEIISPIVESGRLTLINESSLKTVIQTLVLSAAQEIQNDIFNDKLAVRLELLLIYIQALNRNEDLKKHFESDKMGFDSFYRESFKRNLEYAVAQNLIDTRMIAEFDLEVLQRELNIFNDDLYKYIGISTAKGRYMLKDRNQDTLETPQFMWMRVALGISLHENNKVRSASSFYKKLSFLEYSPGGSTIIGSGTTYPALSNCYLIDTEDTIESIFSNVSKVAQISKATGGIGVSVSKLRAAGSPIKTNNTFSSGPIPFMHIFDSTIRAISRAGKKMGALCFYMENWHIDFEEFIDVKENAGDHYRRTRTANTAVFLSDEFMKRVIRNDVWYMFDPAEAPELTETFGSNFSKYYKGYIEKAEAGLMRAYKKVNAREQMKQILVSLVSTSHPWITWKDTINLRALNGNSGMIHCSNLCTEVCLPTSKTDVAVCNLAYINIVKHFNPETNDLNWKQLEETIRIGVRHLDNLIDCGISPIPEAKHSDKGNRAVGLGIMGFAELLQIKKVPYDSTDSYNLIDQIMEFVSYYSIDESTQLAQVKGSYPKFKGSLWSKGMVPFDTMGKLRKERPDLYEQNQNSSLDWNIMREKVKKGVRNATLMMIAPNASTGLVAGTSTGIDPTFAQIFSRATNNGKFLDINHNMVNMLKEKGLWNSCKDKILACYGDLSKIDEIDNETKAVFKTSFQIDPNAYIEVASRAQKWIDQSISRNMYLSTRDVDEIMEVYIKGWLKGLKTTYYLHMLPTSSAEQSNAHVNKSAGRSGFGGIASSSKFAVEEKVPLEIDAAPAQKPLACPLDPQERALCDSCQ